MNIISFKKFMNFVLIIVWLIASTPLMPLNFLWGKISKNAPKSAKTMKFLILENFEPEGMFSKRIKAGHSCFICTGTIQAIIAASAHSGGGVQCQWHAFTSRKIVWYKITHETS